MTKAFRAWGWCLVNIKNPWNMCQLPIQAHDIRNMLTIGKTDPNEMILLWIKYYFADEDYNPSESLPLPNEVEFWFSLQADAVRFKMIWG